MPLMEYENWYFFDHGSGVCLWAKNEATREQFDYPIEHRRLDLSENTKCYLAILDFLVRYVDRLGLADRVALVRRGSTSVQTSCGQRSRTASSGATLAAMGGSCPRWRCSWAVAKPLASAHPNSAVESE